MDILNKSIIEAIRSRYAPPTAESISADSKYRQGVMSRTGKRVDEVLEATASQALSSVADLMDNTRKARTIPEDQETPSLDYYEGEDIDAAMDASIAQDELAENLKETNESVSGEKGLMSPAGSREYSSPDEMTELEILAKTIEAEARGEGYEGKIAVGAVIANRAASGKYGEGISGVILKKGQFSPWNSYTGYAKGEQGKDMLSLKPSEESYKAANAILKGDYVDKTKGATHYLNPEVSTPKWLKAMKGRSRGTVKVGRHLFGNADSEKTYDGKSWISSRTEV